MKLAVGCGTMLVLLCLSFSLLAQETTSNLHVLGVNPHGTDEVITLENASDTSVDLEGWRLQAGRPDRPLRQYVFPAGCTLPAGAVVRVHAGPASLGRADAPCNQHEMDLVWEAGFVLPNEFGAVLLLNAEGQVAVEHYYPAPYAHQVWFSNRKVSLAGTLTLPAAPGPHPAVILISGSGQQNRNEEIPGIPDYKPFATIADYLGRRGIAVLRYDDRGVGGSTGDPTTATTADFATDVEAAARFLAARKDINPRQIGVLGHSEGGIIAAMVAARSPDVAFVISMAGTAVDGYNVIIVQVGRIVQATGASEEDVAQAMELQRAILDLATAQRWAELETLLYEEILAQLQALPQEQQAALGDLEALARQRTGANLEAFRSPWYQFFLKHDPAKDWEKTTVPVLALFGELDVQVDVVQNRAPMEQALTRAGNDDVTVVVFPTANHLFMDAVTGGVQEYTTLPPDFVPGFLKTIADWLLHRVEVRYR